MPVEGSGPGSGSAQDMARDVEIGKPNNSRRYPEATDGAACQSEGRTRLSLLLLVRQDLSSRRSGTRLRLLSRQPGCGRCGRRALRGHRGVRSRTLARGTDGHPQNEDLPTPSAQARVYSQTQRQTAAVVDPHDPRQDGDDGGDVNSRPDLRSRLAAGATWVPTGTQRVVSGAGDTRSVGNGPHPGR
jgi:hypothetical protein